MEKISMVLETILLNDCLILYINWQYFFRISRHFNRRLLEIAAATTQVSNAMRTVTWMLLPPMPLMALLQRSLEQLQTVAVASPRVNSLQLVLKAVPMPHSRLRTKKIMQGDYT
jgi:hypothetical protein